jgi:dTDP-4-dehydrorhamnose 3,5-epimerase
MDIKHLDIPGVMLLTPKIFRDARGFFSETYNRESWQAAGLTAEFVQDNQSLSRDPGVVRGLHFQIAPKAQGKIVRVVRGAIFDVAVDIRPGSPAYGRFVTATLSAENWTQIWIPAGFAHGLCTLEPDTEVIYKVTAPYAPALDRGIAWDDPALGIPWPVAPGKAILSDKDRRHPRLADLAPQVF